MKNYLLSALIGIIFISYGSYTGYNHGKNDAFDSIIMEECWLNKQSRDIECIKRILED